MTFAMLPVVGMANIETYGEYPAVDGNIYYYSKYGEISISDADESITSADIPSQIDGMPVTRIARAAFQQCNNLTSVTIPSSVTEIGDHAFYYCDLLLLLYPTA